jgi:hypothetical protein
MHGLDNKVINNRDDPMRHSVIMPISKLPEKK